MQKPGREQLRKAARTDASARFVLRANERQEAEASKRGMTVAEYRMALVRQRYSMTTEAFKAHMDRTHRA